ncbi:MAG: hypothetical protein Q9169_005714 [Polycauliona sp. 2 TL-2023]
MGTGGLDFMQSGDSKFHSQQNKTMAKALYQDNAHVDIKDFFEETTLKLLHQKSYRLKNLDMNICDITRDVGNLAQVHFAANMFSLPLKTDENPKGAFSEHELYMVLAVIFNAVFLNEDPAESFALRHAARAVSQQLGKLVEANVHSVSMSSVVSGVVDRFRENHNPLSDYGVHLIRRLLDSGLGVSEITWSQILPTAVAGTAVQAAQFTQILDYYLSDEGKQHLPAINKYAKMDTPEGDRQILGYVMEGMRLSTPTPTSGAYRESTVHHTIKDGNQNVPVAPGDKIFCSFAQANLDPEHFPSPTTVRTDRPLDSYIHYGVGPHACLGREASRVALTAMLKVIGRLDNLRRAPGPAGELKKVPRPDGSCVFMRSDYGSYSPFPLTWKVAWDGKLPPLKT